MAETTEDAFLGGRLRIRQPARGYRAGVEPVFLAAAVEAAPGARVLELGCGVGTALLCLGRRLPGLVLTGVERDPGAAALAAENAAGNGIGARILTGDATALPAELRAESFDQVMANPPWFARAAGTGAADPGREAGRRDVTGIAAWIASGARRLVPGGRLTLILPMAALPEALAAMQRDAGIVLISGKKGARAPFTLAPPVVLHTQPRHVADGEDYAPAVRSVLRDALGWAEAQKTADH